MPECVIVRYWKDPIIFLYSSTSTEAIPSNKLKEVVEVIGVLGALAPAILVF